MPDPAAASRRRPSSSARRLGLAVIPGVLAGVLVGAPWSVGTAANGGGDGQSGIGTPASASASTPATRQASVQSATAAAPAPSPPLSRAEALQRRRSPVVEVFEQRRDAVVNIASTEVDEVVVRGRSPFDSLFDDFFDLPRRSPQTRQFTRRSVGSGFVLHPDGYIVTNAHVVSRTADEQKVIFADGGEYDARIVATDRRADLAILKIEADRPLPVLPLGRSDDLLVGETVVAIGNPLGFQHTVTSGVVSATGRSIEIQPGLAFDDLVQTDASINPGNSGGPLLNVLGELIGVNTAIRGDAQNIGFAISVDRLRSALPRLLDVERRYRIITGLTLDPYGEPSVSAVQAASPAATAGLRPGDRLVEVDGRPLENAIDFDIALMGRAAGDDLAVRLVRGEEERRVTMRLAARPTPDGVALASRRLGLEFEELPADVARRIGLTRPGGLVVARVEAGSPADRAGMERLDVLLAVGEVYVSGLEDLGRRLEVARTGEELPIRILRIDRGRKIVLNGVVRAR